ncbi:MAG: glycosyl hydrolase [Ignavibacteriae bacterium]|nr:glycosyl hydrolase [Ignavibacteriota bacterium]MCB9259965.1 glycosyl hydrolase [Ignavibacteriales bacterium]
MSKIILKILLLLFLLLLSTCSNKNEEISEPKINILDEDNSYWAIAYSGYRKGQNPQEKIYPTQDQIKEDLEIIEQNWNLIRTYGADQHAYDILQVIKNEKLNIKVMLGIWLDGEPEYIEDNKNQIAYGTELANEYKDIVIAINVGNESQVHWSDHKVPSQNLVSYIKEVQSKVNVPVTTADTWDYWTNLEKSQDVINAVDFLAVHIYPMWGGVDIDNAFNSTSEVYNKIVSTIPNKKIIISEAGWASYTVGELHAPKAGSEEKQMIYYDQLKKWADENKITVFWFEAFDEPWKGIGTEGHWGLFSESRNAKKAMHELYPKLKTEEPTSPSYE